jgi:hypothetical protein
VARARGLSVRDCVVWTVILGGHALLIFVFTTGRWHRWVPVAVDASAPGVLILLDLPIEASAPEPAPAPESEPEPLAPSRPAIEGLLPLAESTAITLPEEPQPTLGSNAIDWRLEAERSAHSVVKENATRREKRIGEHPPSPFREKPKPKEFDWHPEPERAGFAGFIPYVRIGQRCVVGLGFFGCALGKKPEANGHLFDGMKDPNRVRSSVPDIDTSSALDPPPD